MATYTLRKYLFEKRIELYEKIDELKNKILGEDFEERDVLNLELSETELNVIKDVIEICANRNRY